MIWIGMGHRGVLFHFTSFHFISILPGAEVKRIAADETNERKREVRAERSFPSARSIKKPGFSWHKTPPPMHGRSSQRIGRCVATRARRAGNRSLPPVLGQIGNDCRFGSQALGAGHDKVYTCTYALSIPSDRPENARSRPARG